MTTDRSICSELLRAACYAAEKHRNGPSRKGADAAPYINHPLAVANLLASEAGVEDVEVLQAALLHDVVEDTGTSLQDLEREFGGRVAGLVAEVTDDKKLAKEERKRLQILNAAKKSDGAALIKAADKTCNLREIVASPPLWDVDKKLGYFDHAAYVVERLPNLPKRLRTAFDQAHGLRSRILAGQGG